MKQWFPSPKVLSLSLVAGLAVCLCYPAIANAQIAPSSSPIITNPFPGYKGNVWSKKVKVKSKDYFIFATLDAGPTGGVKVFNMAGALTHSLEPFGSFKPGYNVSAMLDRNRNKVFFAVAPKKWGSSVSIFELRNGRLEFINSAPVTTKTSGNLKVKFMILYRNDKVGLVTVLKEKVDTAKVWSYHPTQKKFVVDTRFRLSRLEITSTSIDRKKVALQ